MTPVARAELLTAYCVRRAGEPGPGQRLRGIDGARVELLEVDGLGVWISPAVPGAPTVERIREHDRVVRAALRSATPLPVRYGTTFADVAGTLEALRAHRETFLTTLERVSGRVEMGVRIGWDPPPLPSEGSSAEPVFAAEVGPGRAYLERRRRERMHDEQVRARAEAVIAHVERFFEKLELSTMRRVLPEPGVAGTLAHLVHRNFLRHYRERAEHARNECFPIRLHVSGPWAPYSFV